MADAAPRISEPAPARAGMKASAAGAHRQDAAVPPTSATPGRRWMVPQAGGDRETQNAEPQPPQIQPATDDSSMCRENQP